MQHVSSTIVISKKRPIWKDSLSLPCEKIEVGKSGALSYYLHGLSGCAFRTLFRRTKGINSTHDELLLSRRLPTGKAVLLPAGPSLTRHQMKVARHASHSLAVPPASQGPRCSRFVLIRLVQSYTSMAPYGWCYRPELAAMFGALLFLFHTVNALASTVSRSCRVVHFLVQRTFIHLKLNGTVLH